MTRVRRGGYVFVAWKSDHAPRHVHVYKDGRLILKWNLDAKEPMKGRASSRLVALIRDLELEGTL